MNSQAELKNALIKLRKAWIETVSAMSNIDFDCNDYIIEDYPFEQSFDEIDVINWIDKSIKKIDETEII